MGVTRWLLVVSFWLAAGSGKALAQSDTIPPTPCTYDSCALRMKGSTLLAGRDGLEVTSFGFLSAPKLRPWIEVSDSAASYALIVEHDYVSGQALTLSGILLALGGLVAIQGWNESSARWIGVGATAASLPMFLIGGRKVRRARDAMGSAIWWYNCTLADASDRPGSGISPPAPLVPFEHRGRAGLALGSVAGLSVGLAVSSRHDSSETVEGLTETIAFTAVGAFLGQLIGKGISR